MSSPRPVICAVIGRTRHKMIQIELHEAAKRGAKLVELRLDFLTKAPDFKRLLTNRPCPVIATFRRPKDGGRWAGTEEERHMLIRQAVVAGVDWIDLEADVAAKIPRFGKVKRIISYHNFDEVPADLDSIYGHMCELDGDVIKLAVTPTQTSDNIRLFNLLKGADKPTIAIGMGDLGACTRILGGKFGSPFTYAAFNKERTIAPGMLSFQELKRVYHYEDIGPETKVFGVIGDPVSHSLSPLIHNKALRTLGIDAIYVPFRVPRGELTSFLVNFQALPVAGYSVTIPHKELAAKLAGEHDPSVDATGAANTILDTILGWKVINTDMGAAMESLREHLPPTEDGKPSTLSSRTVLIVGAGGVARAIAQGLHREGAAITITNRTAEKAQALAEEIGCKVIDWEGRHNVLCDTLINCTSVGMFPNMDDSPVHFSILKPGLLVFDTIYTPETTLLIREAQARGCHVLTGVDMFVRQAAAQFRLFTEKDAPIELMLETVRKALSPVNFAKVEEEDKEARKTTSEE